MDTGVCVCVHSHTIMCVNMIVLYMYICIHACNTSVLAYMYVGLQEVVCPTPIFVMAQKFHTFPFLTSSSITSSFLITFMAYILLVFFSSTYDRVQNESIYEVRCAE